MTVLIVYGFHSEELKFGIDACSKFREYRGITCYQIKNSSMRQSKPDEERGYHEISGLLRNIHPDIVINLHHCMEAVPKKMRDFGKKIAAYDAGFLDLLVFSFPLVLFYENPTSDPQLETYLKAIEFCSMYYSHFPSRLEFNSAIATADSLGIPYIGVEAMISENGDGPIEDEDYLMAKQSFHILIEKITTQTHR